MNLSRSSNAHEAHLLVSALCAFFSYRIRSTSLRVDLAAATTVVELGGARIGVPGHVLGHLDRAAVFKEGGDAGARQLWLQICVVIPAFFARRWSMSQASDWLIRCSVRVPIVLRRWPPSVPESAGNMISVAVVLIAGDEYRYIGVEQALLQSLPREATSCDNAVGNRTKKEIVKMAHGKTEVEDIRALREEIERQRRWLDSLVDRFKEGAGELGTEAYERMRDTTSKASERTKDTVQVVGHKIEEHPFTSLIITFVTGLVLGVLFGRSTSL